MIKMIPPDAWGLDRAPRPTTVKTAAAGFRGHDFTAFLKVASHPLATWVRNNPPQPGEVYVHLIAMGATEKVGANRNADGYRDRMLRRDHPTFEKYARWYMNHQNTDPARSYGVVKTSRYDTDLSRVELIVALNAAKQAAERNGGFVAERTLEKLAAGRDVDVSMSCKIPYDVCNLCGHKARHRGEYCTTKAAGGTCDYAGCKVALGRVYDDGAHQFVDNPHCNFFDISDVSDTRGADRTAFITGKVAGHYVPGGAELAELMGLVPPEHLLEPAQAAQLRCLRKLAAAKPTAPAPAWEDCVAVREKLAVKAARSYSRPNSDYAAHQLVGDLAADGVLLPPAEWLHLTTGVARDKCAGVLGGLDVERDLLARPDLHDRLGGSYSAVGRVTPPGTFSWLAPTAAALGREAATAVVKGAAERPHTANTPERTELAARYLAYQAGVLASHENSSNFPLLLSDAARHTRTHSA